MSLNGHPDAPPRELRALRRLPRPLYGHAEALPNRLLGYRHSHPWVQLSYATRGVLDVHTAGGRFVAPPQRAVWIPPGVAHRVRATPDARINSLYIDPAALAGGGECRVLAISPLLRELIRAFAALPVAYAEDGADGRLVRVLLDQLAAAPSEALMLPLPGDPRLRRLCAALQRQPDDARALAAWGQRLGAAEKTLSRLFRRETGLTFRAWRQRLRLFHALPLLERGERVTDVALACGYDSTSAFIAAFRAQFGATPGAFAGSPEAPRTC